MTTLFLSGPMSGVSDFNYPAFNEVADILRGLGYDVLNPAETDPEDFEMDGEPADWQFYMRQSLHMVADADGIALLPGWRDSRGATLEAHVAEVLGLRLWSIWEWKRSAEVRSA